MSRARVLLIDDEVEPAASIIQALRQEGYQVVVEHNSQSARNRYQKNFDVVVTDLHLEESTDKSATEGFDLIRHFLAISPELPVIVMTGDGSTDMAIEATKLGAFDYITKAFPSEELREMIEELREMIDEAVDASQPKAEPVEIGGTTPLRDMIVGTTPPIREVYKHIGRYAPTDLTVLIRGETGTGKELVARAIHRHSPRSHKPFIAVNCAAIPETLLESELFGYEKGAFTGAERLRLGRFEQANGGTIFLDEIGDMNQQTQAKLLRVLQEKQIQRLGGQELISTDVRIIAATHRDLESAIKSKTFREDLFYRLNVASIVVPPLRERLDDLSLLVDYFLRRHAASLHVPLPSVHQNVVPWLQRQSWPGNVRELENLVCKTMLLARGQTITDKVFRSASGKDAADKPVMPHQPIAAYISELLDRAVVDGHGKTESILTWTIEQELYRQAIQRSNGNQVLAARWLGVSRPTLRKKLALYGLS